MATRPQPSRPALFISIALALIGFLLSVFLTLQSLNTDAVAGCGGDAGCAEVLSSRWAKLGPIPVSIFGVLTYFGVLLGLGARMGSKGYSVLGDRLLWLTPPLLLTAAVWFTGLQLFAVGAVCPFCMASHVIGFVLALLLLLGVMRTTITNPKPPLLAGFLAAGFFIVFQAMMTPTADAPQRAPNPFADQDGDTWIDDARYVSVFGGELQFVLQDVPYIGQADAEQVVVVLFDYACPHCRTLHKMLNEAIKSDPSRFVLVPVPLSIHENMNPYIASDDERFERSNLLAIYSMAAGAIDLETYKTYDRWLFNSDGEGEFPRSHNDAISKAIQLFGGNTFKEQLGEGSEQYKAMLERNIDLIGLLPEDKRFIPVTTTPGAPEHLTTRYDEIEVLYELLDLAKPSESE